MNRTNFYNQKYMSRGNNMNGNRMMGTGFLAPFLLGGITGGLLAPAFYPRPMYTPVMVYPRPIYQNSYPIYY